MNGSIGIFDSGLGGLTVLKELAEKFPKESFCYLGDIARLPYGNKSPETIKLYGLQILKFLKTQNVKALIIACNSASTVFLDDNSYEGIPLLNVIGPGAQEALRISRDKKIAVLGTAATIRSGAYSKTLKSIDSKASVTEIPCPLFVPLVEEGVVGDKITELIIHRYLNQVIEERIKTVILGCTHYPLLKADLTKILGNEVKLVESGVVLGEELKQLFQTRKILTSKEDSRQIRLCITDLTDHFERLAHDLMGPNLPFSLEKIVL